MDYLLRGKSELTSGYCCGCAALSLEAIRAVDRLFAGGLEGHLAGFATGGASGLEHFAGATAAATATSAAETTGSFALCAAIRAAARGVGEAFFGMKFLLAGSKGEIVAALAASQCFVGVAHRLHSLACI